jgi:hypothetical protein
LGAGLAADGLAQSPNGLYHTIDDTGKKTDGPSIPIPDVKKSDAEPFDAAKQKNRVVQIKEAGKPDRQCIVTSEDKLRDGSVRIRLVAIDNGEVITINLPGDSSTVAPAEKMPLGQLPPSSISLPPLPVPAVPSVETFPLPQSSLPAASGAPIGEPLVVDQAPTAAVVKPERPSLWRKVRSTPDAKPAVVGDGGIDQSAPAVAATEQPSLWKRLFGDRPAKPRRDTTVVQSTTVQVGIPTLDPTPGFASVNPMHNPAADSTPGYSTVNSTPGHVDAAPRESSLQAPTVANKPPIPTMGEEPLPIATGGGRSGGRLNPEASRLQAVEYTLSAAELPAQRMAAAEEILLCVPGRVDEVRTALFRAAQDDQAPCVRAACIRALSKLNTRDATFTSLLGAALDDPNPDIRDEAAYALQKINQKK